MISEKLISCVFVGTDYNEPRRPVLLCRRQMTLNDVQGYLTYLLSNKSVSYFFSLR